MTLSAPLAAYRNFLSFEENVSGTWTAVADSFASIEVVSSEGAERQLDIRVPWSPDLSTVTQQAYMAANFRILWTDETDTQRTLDMISSVQNVGERNEELQFSCREVLQQ